MRVVSHRRTGVPSLDEAPESSARSPDALRQPLESGRLSITRGGHRRLPGPVRAAAGGQPLSVRPAGRALLVRPRHPSPLPRPAVRAVLDRIDLRVEVPRITRTEMLAEGRGELSAASPPGSRSPGGGPLSAVRARRGEPAGRFRRRAPPPLPVPRRLTVRAEEAMDSGQLAARGSSRVPCISFSMRSRGASVKPTLTSTSLPRGCTCSTGEAGNRGVRISTAHPSYRSKSQSFQGLRTTFSHESCLFLKMS